MKQQFLMTACALVGRPDVGFTLVAIWTAICLVVHAVQILQGHGLAYGQRVIRWHHQGVLLFPQRHEGMACGHAGIGHQFGIHRLAQRGRITRIVTVHGHLQVRQLTPQVAQQAPHVLDVH